MLLCLALITGGISLGGLVGALSAFADDGSASRLFRDTAKDEIIELGPELAGYEPTASGLFMKGQDQEASFYDPVGKKIYDVEELCTVLGAYESFEIVRTEEYYKASFITLRHTTDDKAKVIVRDQRDGDVLKVISPGAITVRYYHDFKPLDEEETETRKNTYRYIRDDFTHIVYKIGYQYLDYQTTYSGLLVHGEGENMVFYDPIYGKDYTTASLKALLGFDENNKDTFTIRQVEGHPFITFTNYGDIAILRNMNTPDGKFYYGWTSAAKLETYAYPLTELTDEEVAAYQKAEEGENGGVRYFRDMVTEEVIKLGPEFAEFEPTYSGFFLKGKNGALQAYDPQTKRIYGYEDFKKDLKLPSSFNYKMWKDNLDNLPYLAIQNRSNADYTQYVDKTDTGFVLIETSKNSHLHGFKEMSAIEVSAYLEEGSVQNKLKILEEKRKKLLEQYEEKKKAEQEGTTVSENTPVLDDETAQSDIFDPSKSGYFINPEEGTTAVSIEQGYQPFAGGYFINMDVELMLDANNGIISDLDLAITAGKSKLIPKGVTPTGWSIENGLLIMTLSDGSKLAYDGDLRQLTSVEAFQAKVEKEHLAVFEQIAEADVYQYQVSKFIDEDPTEMWEDLLLSADSGSNQETPDGAAGETKVYEVPVGGAFFGDGYLYFGDRTKKAGMIINIRSGERFKIYTPDYTVLCTTAKVEDGGLVFDGKFYDPSVKKWTASKPAGKGKMEKVRVIGDKILRNGEVAWQDNLTLEIVIAKKGWIPLHGGAFVDEAMKTYKVGESGEVKNVPNGFTRLYHSNLYDPVSGKILNAATGQQENRLNVESQGEYVLFDLSGQQDVSSGQKPEQQTADANPEQDTAIPFVEAAPNTYILEATTGAEAGDNIAFFIITYKSEGKERSIYVFPKAGDFADGMREMNEMAEKNNVNISAINQDYMSYTDVVNASLVGTGNSGIVPLQSESKNQVLFHTKEPIDEVTNVQFFTHYVKGGHNGWTCQGLSIYEVENIYGLDMVGGFSKEYFANFSGKLLSDVIFKNSSSDGGFRTFTWANDEILSFNGRYVEAADGTRSFQKDPYSSIITGGFDNDGVYDPNTNDRYGFRIDFADQAGAGLECLSHRTKSSLKSGNYVESLAMRMVYTDVAGKTRVLSVPVITNALKWAADHGIGQSEVAGVYQVGQSLYFEGMIPGFARVNTISLTTGNDKAIALCGMKKQGSPNAVRQERQNLSKEDSIAISLFAMYHIKDGVSVKAGMDGSFVSYAYSGMPIFYRKAETEYGLEVEPNTEITLQLTTLSSENDLTPPGWNSKKYLIGVTTDQSRTAGTLADVKMQFEYTNTSGLSGKTDWYSLREMAKSFYGFWYSDTTKNGDFGYVAGMSPGNTMYFIISVPDVDQFTNAAYQLESGTDDWQTNGLQIWALDSVSPLESDWTLVNSQNGDTILKSDARFYREFSGINILNIVGSTTTGNADEDDQRGSESSYLPDSLLVQSGEPVEWVFKSKDLEETEEEAFANIGYDMTYEDCLQNFGFDKSRKSYTVKVKVSDQAVDLSGNGDCGSKNNFYFQLLFENGSSGVVLANTQLEGDTFRTGNTESFVISTNRDYGELTGVRIIPESVMEDAQVDDKLRIDEIRIVEQSLNSFSETWVVEGASIPNEGWIGIQDYMDDAEKKTNQEEKKGRLMADIAVDLPITVHTNELNLLCCLTTDEYSENTSQFYGEMKMTVDYIQTDGTPSTETFDIVDAMYKYYNKPVQHDTDTVDQGRTATRDPAVSSTYLMFRGGHTDRFNITLRNVKSLYQATLTGQSRGDTSELSIAALSFNTIEEAGRLQLSNKDEYVRTGKTTLITSNSVVTGENAKLANTFAKGDDQKIKIGLLPNEVEVKDQGSKWLAVFSREPLSQNDTLNVYIYPTDDSIPVSSYNLQCKAEYTNVSGMPYATANMQMQKHEGTGENGDRSYFFINGLSAKGIASLDALIAVATTGGDINAYADYAVVQQVRSGTVINTWQKNGGRGLLASGVRMITQGEKTKGLYDQQKVLLQLSDEGTQAAKLIAEKEDIAVSIRYTTTVDPTSREVYSAYKYLTDEQITRIQAGDVVEMWFNEPYVKDITGLRIIKFGDTVQATLDGAAVVNYERASSADKEPLMNGWFSFTDKIVLMGTPTTLDAKGTMIVSENVVQPLKISFTTAKAGGFTESGTATPVRMTIGYEDVFRNVHEVTYEDIRAFIADRDVHSFNTGETQEIYLLTKGMQKVRYLTLEPYTDAPQDGSYSITDNVKAGWTIDEISAMLGENGIPVSRSLGERITEGQPKKINLTNLSFAITAFYYSRAIDANETRTVVDKDADFTVATDIPITFRPDLYGSDEGFTITVSRKVGDTMEPVPDVVKAVNNKNTKKTEYVFTPPSNYTGTNQVYYVVFESKENNAVKVQFTITVQSGVTVSENSAQSGDTTSTDTGSSDSTSITDDTTSTDSANTTEVRVN